jgi:hypothetical protein
LGAHLSREGKVIVFRDRATGSEHKLPVEAARDPAGLLPVFTVAGEAVWREATGKGFALDIRRDDDALFGRRLHAVGAGTFSTVLLSVMEAVAQASGPSVLAVNDLRVQWAASVGRAHLQKTAGATQGFSPS